VILIFGGVPWDFILAATCVTLSAVAVAAAAGLRQSINRSRMVTALLVAVAQCACVYAFTRLVVTLIGLRNLGAAVHFLPDPFLTMRLLGEHLLNPGGGMGAGRFWPAQCVVLLLIALALLRSCSRRIRARSEQLAFEPPPATWMRLPRPLRKMKDAVVRFAEQFVSSDLRGRRFLWRRMGNWPVAWKDSRYALLISPAITSLVLAICAIGLVDLYLLTAVGDLYSAGGFHAGLVVAFLVPGLLATACASAISIALERESRCWTFLLLTTMTEWRLLVEKAWGAIRRGLPAWALLGAHLVLFTIFGQMHGLLYVHLAMLLVGQLVFLTALGLYLSLRLRRPALALAATLGAVAFLWFVVPPLVVLALEAAKAPASSWLADLGVYLNPLVQAHLFTGPAAGEFPSTLVYHWPRGDLDAQRTTTLLFYCAGIHVLAGLALAWRTVRRFRRAAD